MNASEVRQMGGDVSATVIDAAADLASRRRRAGRGGRVSGSSPTRWGRACRIGRPRRRAAESVRMLQELSDPRLQLLMRFPGRRAGLWMAGAPRLVTSRRVSCAGRRSRDRITQAGNHGVVSA